MGDFTLNSHDVVLHTSKITLEQENESFLKRTVDSETVDIGTA